VKSNLQFLMSAFAVGVMTTSLFQILAFAQVSAEAPTTKDVIGGYTKEAPIVSNFTEDGRERKRYTYFLSNELQRPLVWLKIEEANRNSYFIQTGSPNYSPKQRERYAIIKESGTWRDWREVVFDCKTGEYRNAREANWRPAGKVEVGAACRNFTE
jgi:hypothetical protein